MVSHWLGLSDSWSQVATALRIALVLTDNFDHISHFDNRVPGQWSLNDRQIL